MVKYNDVCLHVLLVSLTFVGVIETFSFGRMLGKDVHDACYTLGRVFGKECS
jgi:hypothetical protein